MRLLSFTSPRFLLEEMHCQVQVVASHTQPSFGLYLGELSRLSSPHILPRLVYLIDTQTTYMQGLVYSRRHPRPESIKVHSTPFTPPYESSLGSRGGDHPILSLCHTASCSWALSNSWLILFSPVQGYLIQSLTLPWIDEHPQTQISHFEMFVSKSQITSQINERLTTIVTMCKYFF